MKDYISILQKYWGYNQFRPLQLEIIQSVIEKKDTLALLPTGGGKSICFQLPAIYLEGICLVISPLIALMHDQVKNLKQKGIEAIALHSGMKKKEVDIALDNCIYGSIKFLYLSPERLKSEIFLERFHQMKINLIAIDEAHCISQWGYDFRPPYLEISQIRKYHPGVPVIALTATATEQVCDDIQEKLAFKEKNIFKSSFVRKNIALIARYCDDKETKLLEILNSIPGTAIVYVRNRKRTKEIAAILKKNFVNADFYHAGLEAEARINVQKNWIENKIRVIVCTNAFGMGIDKPDVRIVVHMDAPESPEAFYQEAGRAGRDGKKSYAGFIFHETDLFTLQHFAENAFPPISVIQNIYQLLGNYYSIAFGSGKNESFDFDIIDFCEKYKLRLTESLNALKILQQQNYIYLSDDFRTNSSLLFTSSKEILYKFQVENASFEYFIKTILRLSPGIFDDPIPISEKEIAFHTKMTKEKVVESLLYLEKIQLVSYFPVKLQPQCTFLTERFPSENLQLDYAGILKLKEIAFQRSNRMYLYLQNKVQCRMQHLLEYFGESVDKCGVCDICVERNKLSIPENDFNKVFLWLQQKLQKTPLETKTLLQQNLPVRKEIFLDVVSYLKDNRIIIHTNDNMLKWNA